MDDLIETIKEIALTTVKNQPGLLVENCCDNAPVTLIFEEWGVAWHDGVRRWNRGKLISAECSKCGKHLQIK